MLPPIAPAIRTSSARNRRPSRSSASRHPAISRSIQALASQAIGTSPSHRGANGRGAIPFGRIRPTPLPPRTHGARSGASVGPPRWPTGPNRPPRHAVPQLRVYYLEENNLLFILNNGFAIPLGAPPWWRAAVPREGRATGRSRPPRPRPDGG